MTAAGPQGLEDFLAALLNDDPADLWDRAPCGYLSTAADGTIRKANTTFSEMTGYSLDDLVGVLRLPELLSVGGRIYYETHFAPMLHMHGTAREIALDLVRSDGVRLPVLVNAVADRTENGDVAVIRAAVFDATHRRKYEQELLRAKERAEASEAQAQQLARTLQQTLIPPAPPHIPHLDVAARYRPAGDGAQVGGDFYDVFPVAGDDWVIVLGDVQGKGVDAAVITALVRHTLRAAAVDTDSPAGGLRLLNDVLRLDADNRFCTCAYLRLRNVDGRWHGVLAAGGHPLPILRGADGAVQQLGEHGTMLGVIAQPRLPELRFEFTAGDCLVLYTDGLTEARRDGELFGEQRTCEVLGSAHADAAGSADALLSAAVDFQGGTARDDIAIVVIRVPDAA